MPAHTPNRRRRPLDLAMMEAGYEKYDNGGGFVAWRCIVSNDVIDRRDNEIVRVLVTMLLTDHDSPGAPMMWNDRGAVCLTYEEVLTRNGMHDAEPMVSYSKDFPSIEAFMGWEATTEYVLPENGDGWKANGWYINPI